jgi:hypothetical protein
MKEQTKLGKRSPDEGKKEERKEEKLRTRPGKHGNEKKNIRRWIEKIKRENYNGERGK